jgi:hypothetical protein
MGVIEDVERRAWWPYPTSDVSARGGLGSFWLPSPPSGEAELLSELASAWSDMTWLLMGTWHRKQRDLPARGIADRYPGLACEVFARSESESPRGIISNAEWCVADTSSSHLFGFLDFLRRSRGKGGCLALVPKGSSPRTWYALSTGMLWRSTLALEVESAISLEGIHASIISQYLSQMVECDYISMVPLDHHPWGGYATFGKAERLASVATNLSNVRLGSSEADARDIFAHGGGIAF